jgi:sulfotransferase
MKTIYFLSGLPRAGSTLLASLLNQHPDIHASATSALLELLVSQANSVSMNRIFYEITDAQEIEVYNGIVNSFYKHIDKNIIIDKHRGWPNLVPALKKMGIEAKIICSNRPVSEIVTSYITLIDKNPTSPNFIDELIVKRNLPINIHNRAMTIWTDYVQIPHTALINAMKTHRDNLCIVNYNDIINTPQKTLQNVEIFLGAENYDGYKFDNIKNEQPEKDENGWRIKDLHLIRPKLEKTSKSPEKIIGTELAHYFSQFDINV